MQDMNDFEHYDTTMGRARRPQDPIRTVMPVIGYRCTTHDFETRSKMGLQLHTNGCGRECHIDVLREDPAPPPLPPKPEPAEPPHVGPHWEHDCEACIYLGSMPHYDKQYDLYWCPPNKFNERGNVIARHGIMGDYVSGIDWIDREPMLAIAAVLAMKAGHLTYADVVTTRNH
jgi:hypothetical protein